MPSKRGLHQDFELKLSLNAYLIFIHLLLAPQLSSSLLHSFLLSTFSSPPLHLLCFHMSFPILSLILYLTFTPVSCAVRWLMLMLLKHSVDGGP